MDRLQMPPIQNDKLAPEVIPRLQDEFGKNKLD